MKKIEVILCSLLIFNFQFSTFNCLASCTLGSQADPLPQADEVLEIIRRVNRHWQTANPEHGRAFWDNAAYHTGNMEVYALTGDPDCLAYSEAWAEHNEWRGAKSDNRGEWKYGYGESDEYVLFGDYQICFQTYADLYNVKPDPRRIARAREVMEYEMATDKNDYWWWADGLYMVMPVMTKLYKITGNPLYLEKQHEYWTYANSIMYDGEAGLYYRDAKYVYPRHKSVNGKKDFWARGDGWVLAALAKVLKELPEENAYRKEYTDRFQTMAAAVAACQQPEGYWTRSLLDPEHAPGPETSGTAFFTYALLWGMNNGLLDKATYQPVVLRAWNYLTTTALQGDGRIGYVQPIGEKAIPGQVVDANSTANFGVGAFLLASCEMVRFVQPQFAGYLFAYFTKESEAVRFALSRDGYNYRALNGNRPVLDSKRISSTGGVRDPHLLRGKDGKTFYMVLTDMVAANGWDSNRAMVLLKSTDLVNWTSSVVNIQQKYKGQEDLKRVWAPQTIYDRATGKYMIYWSMKHGDGPDIIYYAYANPDFTDLEGEPRVLFLPRDGKACIDGDIVEKNGLYHLFYKTEGHGDGIRRAITDSLGSGRWVEQPGYKQQTRQSVEGSFVFKLTGQEKYILMYDVYRDRQYQFCESLDLDTFRAIDTQITMDFHPRHGAIIPVTEAEIQRLTTKWN